MDMISTQWLLSLFVNVLPTETVLRVWDIFFLDGREAPILSIYCSVLNNNLPVISVVYICGRLDMHMYGSNPLNRV